MADVNTLVIGIDFGTTRSSLGFCYREQGTEKFFLNAWNNVPGQLSHFKGPTCILYNRKDPVAIGYTALSKYNSERRTNPNLKLYSRFKLKLKELTIDDIKTVQVVADFLRLLKEEASEFFRKKCEGKGIDQFGKITWCLTVPAIWDDSQKDVMIKAAQLGGLTKSSDPIASGELVIVLEPEAAAATFRENAEKSGTSPNGKIIMVVDGGGGTIDLTIHRIINNSLEEIAPGTGNQLGGDTINQKFLQCLEEHFEDIENFKLTHPKSWHSVQNGFERAKVLRENITNIDFPLPALLIESKRGKHQTYNIVLDDDENRVEISKEQFKELWDIVLVDAKRVCKEILDSMEENHIDYIYLVGGLSCSKIFQQALESICPTKTKFMLADRPDTAIVEGAILFGKRVDLVSKRVLRRTYGIAIRDKKSNSDLFFPLILKGDSADFGIPVSQEFPTPHYTVVRITLYEFSGDVSDIPTHVNGPGIEKVGELIVDVVGDPEMRGVVVKLFFASSSLELETIDLHKPQNTLKKTFQISE